MTLPEAAEECGWAGGPTDVGITGSRRDTPPEILRYQSANALAPNRMKFERLFSRASLLAA